MIIGCIGALLLAAGPGVVQDAAGKAAQAAGQGANKPLFVSRRRTRRSPGTSSKGVLFKQRTKLLSRR
jgi:hypothetical protein